MDNLAQLLHLTTNADGANLNLANFKKVYNYYDTEIFHGELKKTNRKHGFSITRMYSREQGNFEEDLTGDLFTHNEKRNTLYGKDHSYFKENLQNWYPNLIAFTGINVSLGGGFIIEYFPITTRFINGKFITTDRSAEVRQKLGFQNNTQLLNYMVEEFILDGFYIMNNPTLEADPSQYKQQLSQQYFNRIHTLQNIRIDSSFYSVLQL